jgi:2-polyprenyl-3-methyl-5-hydroxy-6-metoxy-1,4-benzoquinol methylase
MNEYSEYFDLRNVDSDFYLNYKIPKYIVKILPSDKNTDLLDIGCGFGSFLREVKKQGYNSVKGIDISEQAIEFALKQNFDVQKISIKEFAEQAEKLFDFITMSHVLEHINKVEIINTLKLIREKLLKENGKLCLMVPNAQSNTDSYWAYEDFTHTTLFTSGSLLYVLKAAGFTKIKFLDPDGTENSKGISKFLKKVFLPLYRIKKSFWNKVTSSSFHAQSPNIFTFELKVLAEK